MNVFDLFAKISLDTRAYESALTGAKGMAEGFGSSLRGIISNAVGVVSRSLETAGRTAANFVSDSVATGREFDQAMSQVAATMGTTVDEITDLRDFAREMGSQTKYSATDAADALNYMALAGYDATVSMQMLPNVLYLAAAGNFDLARASDMVTDTQTAFGISLERTTRLVDEMAKAASTGNTNVEQLGDAFLTVGGLAQELNGGFVTLVDGSRAEVDGVQELEIALTAMANAGIKGSEAGTHMRNMLLKLSAPTADGAEAFEELGVQIFSSTGQMRSLSDVFGDLSNAFGNMTQQEKLKAISKIFNTRDTAASEALLNAVGQDWNDIGAAILDAAGAAQQMAETQLDNLEGDVVTFNSVLEEAKITISDAVSPALRDMVQIGTKGIRDLTEAYQANGLRGLATMVRLDLQDVKNKIERKLPELTETGKSIVQSITDGIESRAASAGESVLPLLSKIGEKLTDPTARQAVYGYAFHVISNFAEGLLSEESIDQFIETAPKIVENLCTSISDSLTGENHDGEGGLFGTAKKIITKLTDYFSEEENREKFKDAAVDMLLTLGQFLVDNVSQLARFALDVGRALAEAVITAFLDSLLPIFNSEHGWLQEYLNADTNLSYPEWAAQRHEAERQSNTTSQSYLDSSLLISGGAGGAAAASAYYSAMHINGYATGGVFTRPTYALIGEDGAEAVMPLERNTEWIDQLADRLNRQGGSGITISFGDIIVNGTSADAGEEVVRQIDEALRTYQVRQQRGIGGTAWQV